jgi:hypothetical protein
MGAAQVIQRLQAFIGVVWGCFLIAVAGMLWTLFVAVAVSLATGGAAWWPWSLPMRSWEIIGEIVLLMTLSGAFIGGLHLVGEVVPEVQRDQTGRTGRVVFVPPADPLGDE